MFLCHHRHHKSASTCLGHVYNEGEKEMSENSVSVSFCLIGCCNLKCLHIFGVKVVTLEELFYTDSNLRFFVLFLTSVIYI